MIDANSQFFALLTAVGEAKQVKADAGLITWKLTHMAVGDANDTNPIPDRLQKTLINERRRAPLNSLGPDPANPGILIAEQIIPADEGGFWIRELGLFDSDGDLVAVANCAPSYKSLLSQGSGKTQVLRMNFVVKSSSNVVLLIDPSVVTATRKYVDDSVANAVNRLDTKQSVLVATTAPMVLAGVQVIDGLAAPVGSRVLVKDQVQAKDNGLYLVTAESWIRTVDADSNEKVSAGLLVAVERGSSNADTLWQLFTDAPIVLGTTALTFRSITGGLAPLESPAFTGDPKAPTPTRFDRDKSVATTEYVQSALGSYSGLIKVTDPTITLTKEHAGFMVVLTSATAITVKLPLASSVPAGVSISFFGDHLPQLVNTVTRSGVDLINVGGNNYVPTLEIGNSDFMTLVSDGNIGWFATSRSVSLEKLPAFATLKDINGYMNHPGRFIEQWGLSGATTDKVNVTFPQQFSKVLNVIPYDSTVLGGVVLTQWQISGITGTGFTAQNVCSLQVGSSTVNSPSLSQCNWRAWGWVDK
ncbi:phage tail protein [Pseudomonas sp. WS 5406]|uniref:phage tail protein n=1 Tax=Pseudomonas sp. WS 5406 TaxID=2717498 RepID=UPI001472ED89|nr:phage tail protein [Pseudomonas sp. WS 5406]NMX26600.1 phage tail protein [Pseudomonas sp. WS 5406]